MEFWKHLLDPRKNRKVKGFVLATVLLLLGKIDDMVWLGTFGVFVGGTSAEKIATTLGKKK